MKERLQIEKLINRLTTGFRELNFDVMHLVKAIHYDLCYVDDFYSILYFLTDKLYFMLIDTFIIDDR